MEEENKSTYTSLATARLFCSLCRVLHALWRELQRDVHVVQLVVAAGLTIATCEEHAHLRAAIHHLRVKGRRKGGPVRPAAIQAPPKSSSRKKARQGPQGCGASSISSCVRRGVSLVCQGCWCQVEGFPAVSKKP